MKTARGFLGLLLFALCTGSTPGVATARPELVVQIGHKGDVARAVISPSGQSIATVGEDGTIKIWDAKSGELRHALEGGWAVRVAFSRDGSTLFGSSYRTLQGWSTRTGEHLRTVATTSGSGEFSPDATRLAISTSSAASSSVQLWDTGTGEWLDTLTAKPSPTYLTSLAWSHDGSTLAAGDYGGKVFFWRARDGAHFKTIDFRPPAIVSDSGFNARHLAFSADGKTLAADCNDAVRLAEIASGRITRKISLGKNHSQHQAILFSRDGDTLFGAPQGNPVRLWDIKTGKLKGHLAQTYHVHSLGYALGANALLLAGNRPRLGLWDAKSSQPRRIFRRIAYHHPHLKTLQLSLDTRFLLAFGWQGEGALWDWKTLTRTAFPREGKWLRGAAPMIVSIQENFLEWRRAPGGAVWKRIAIPKPAPSQTLTKAGEVSARQWEHNLRAIAVSPDGKMIAAFNSKNLFLFEPKTGKLLRTLAGRSETINAAEFSPDGKFLAAGGDEEMGWGDERGSVTIWNLQDKSAAPRTLLAHAGVQSLAWARDGKTLAVGCGNEEGEDEWGEIQIFDAPSGRLKHYLLGHKSPVIGLAFVENPSGRATLVAASRRDTKGWSAPLEKKESIASEENAQPLWTLERGAQVVSTWPGSGNFLMAFETGQIEIRSAKDAALRATLLTLPPDSQDEPTKIFKHWLLFTPEGFYTGSPNCERWIRWRVKNKIFPAAKFKSQFSRPAKVRQALQNNG